MKDEELTRDWPKDIREMALSTFDCQECGMHAADWRFLLDRYAALREIVEAVAELSTYNDLCECWSAGCTADWFDAGQPHRPECIYMKAKALLGQTAQEVE